MPVSPDVYIHEEIERRREGSRLDAQLSKLGTQVVVAVRVVTRDAVLDAIHLDATRRIEKVMPANVVGDDGEHPLAAIGPERVPRREIDLPSVVERAAVREALTPILGEGNEIAALSALGIDDPQAISAPESQPHATCCGYELLHGHPPSELARLGEMSPDDRSNFIWPLVGECVGPARDDDDARVRDMPGEEI